MPDGLRIVSLLASATEMVAALGLAERLVGISHECDWPPTAVAGRPVLTRPKVDITRRSLDIHQDVQQIVARGLSVYEIDTDALVRARPTHIITQDQCEVCAVTRTDVMRATRQCLGTDASILTLHPDRLDDIFSDIRTVATGLGVAPRGEALIGDLRRSMARIAATARALSKRPRVVCLEWTNPLMAAGNWIPELVDMAGAINGLTRVGEHTRVVSWNEIVDFDPDLLLIMPCGYTIAQTLANRADWESLPGWATTRVVRNQQVWFIDGNTYLNRPGPRIVESLAILAGLCHPETLGPSIPLGSVARYAP